MSLVLEKAIKLIDLVAADIRLQRDIAGAAGLPRSTTHRLLTTLVKHNYLAVDGHRFALGYRLLELGEMKKRSFDYLDILHPIISRYAELVGDTVHLAVLDDRDIVLLDAVRGRRELQINSYRGLRNTAFMTAVGKVLIGQLPERSWKSFIGAVPPGYRKTEQEILQDFRRAQRHNVAVDMDECSIGTCGIASSFPAGKDRRLACSINGATVYFDPDRMKELETTVRDLATTLQQAMERY
ncbi:MAG: IclR family transcriptional regulator, partial [Methylobacteriaceae bacterium]|nr:IclR family transcriptional regulator [Methylobacteriaceae bacterium]